MNQRLIDKAKGLLSKEKGTIYKKPGGRVSVCLIYPNTYHVGMSNLGFQGVYTLLNARDDVLSERAFLPDAEDIGEYERTGTEAFSLEFQRPLRGFDILAFSVSFENDYPNVLRILRLANVPVESTSRGPHHPLVVMGGVCAFSNPEPMAGFMDVFFVGEAEEMLDEFMDIYRANAGGTRERLLKEALAIQGVYVPRFYEVTYDGKSGVIAGRSAIGGAPGKITRRHVKDISSRPLIASITTSETEFSGMRLVEAMRGCPWGCRFCLAGHVYNPPRTKDFNAVEQEVREALTETRRVGLVGPSLTDYKHKEEVLILEGVDFSITSLRASPRSAEVVALLKGHKSISIAPEAGSQRLRDFINKRITRDDILRTSELLYSHGIQRLRLYFMVGLPTEGKDDMEGMVELVGAVRERFGTGRITLSLSTFVPKPCTPFERYPMADIKTIKERVKFIKRSLKPLKGVRVFSDVPKYAHMQGLFAMGDRRVGGVLMEMLEQDDWRVAARRAGVDPGFYVMRKKPAEEILPWDYITDAP
jgi:radical SAM superfamily enzyme YgiQ (UPF0313 family)